MTFHRSMLVEPLCGKPTKIATKSFFIVLSASAGHDEFQNNVSSNPTTVKGLVCIFSRWLPVLMQTCRHLWKLMIGLKHPLWKLKYLLIQRNNFARIFQWLLGRKFATSTTSFVQSIIWQPPAQSCDCLPHKWPPGNHSWIFCIG